MRIWLCFGVTNFCFSSSDGELEVRISAIHHWEASILGKMETNSD